MLRFVVDPGVLLSGLIAPSGPPGALLERWSRGSVQFVASPLLIQEFTDVAARPKFRTWFSEDESRGVAALLASASEMHVDVETDTPLPEDDGDAYLLHLTFHARAFALVTGDRQLREHAVRSGLRILTPVEAVDIVSEWEER
jgi:putative PIN family toxin of toxin-antitoxin system